MNSRSRQTWRPWVMGLAAVVVTVWSQAIGFGLALDAPAAPPDGADRLKPAAAAPATPGVAGAPAMGPSGGPPNAGGDRAGGAYFYDHAGRRDPFAPIIQVEGKSKGPENINLPPLQRVNVSEINLIGIVWGGFGYTAMVQTPDGKGYTVRQGTRMGPNDGVVSAITETSIVVRERFSDVYGNKQTREHVKQLHPRQGTE